MSWQIQEARQRFSEVLRRAAKDGPQIVTRRGDEVAVVMDIEEYRRLKGEEPSLKDFLLSRSDPFFEDDLVDELTEIQRSRGLPREVDLGDDER